MSSGSSGSVTSVLAQLVIIEGTMNDPATGLSVFAFPNIPTTMTPTQMPCFINRPKNALRTDKTGSDELGQEYLELRNYDVQLFLAPLPSGVEQEKSGLLTPWFDLVYTTFEAYPHLMATAEIMNVLLESDTGDAPQQFAGTNYYGITFRLLVNRRVRRVFAYGE
jgi:hypothetical protein